MSTRYRQDDDAEWERQKQSAETAASELSYAQRVAAAYMEHTAAVRGEMRRHQGLLNAEFDRHAEELARLEGVLQERLAALGGRDGQ